MMPKSPPQAISIGGWCGVAMVTRGTLGLCSEAYPFDYVLSTFAGVLNFLRHDFDGFFPDSLTPHIQENGQPLFKGQHTVFPHHDLQNPEIRAMFQRRIHRLEKRLAQGGPLLLIRASGALFDETALIPAFENLLHDRFPRLEYRLLFISHHPVAASQPSCNTSIRYLSSEESWEKDYPGLIREELARMKDE